ncbi:MAG: tetratricopeptide repeat protein, partial [Bacteroidota bacterium]
MFGSKTIVYALLLAGACLLIYCNQGAQHAQISAYKNLEDSVAYVGMATCISCHSNIHQTFQHTGMGRSFDRATPQKSAANYSGHELVYDQKNDLYYRPFFQDSVLYIQEFRLEGKDTVHQRTEQISYIIGSGHHTNSHIININGYIFQAPITYYTQDGKWDLAPGYERENQRFERTLTPECITCHNHFPKFTPGSLNRFSEMPSGIECERCHGPGEIHVKEKLAGEIIDTAHTIDYSIVNPRDLPRDLQMDLCQRCHLQGVAVLEEGKSFFDFKPGMRLSDVVNVYLPRMSNSGDRFIMASQADRLRLSKCYQLSEMSCLTCHNPHLSVEQVERKSYNGACQSCHQSTNQVACSAPVEDRTAVGDNCVQCHMPPSGSIDIPHINITDHYISKFTATRSQRLEEEERAAIAEFVGLEMLTKSDPSPLEMAKGYIALHDKFMSNSAVLDSAAVYLKQVEEQDPYKFKAQVHYHFARQEYTAIARLATTKTADQIDDAWTAYRLGEALYKQRKVPTALLYYKKATQLHTYNLEFQEKLGIAYLSMQNLGQARKTFQFILQENPKRKLALNNLGYVYALKGQLELALSHYDRALALDPDYEQALLNKAAIFLKMEKTATARQL